MPMVNNRVASAGLLCLLSFLSLTPVPAQETRGSIQGRVMDSTGAVVPNVAVTAVNAGTNVASKTRSNAEGNYTLLFLAPGIYDISAVAQGFKTVRRQGIELQIHQRLQVDLALEVGAVSEEVRSLENLHF